MLSERGFIKKESIESIHTNLLKKYSDKLTFSIKTDKKEATFAVLFITQKITTINKVHEVEEFFKNNESNNKIFVVSEVSQKVVKQLYEFPNTEIFYDSQLMINLIDHDIFPKHEVLTEEEANQLLENYKIKKYNLSKIKVTDAGSRYYGLKVGDIVRIVRPSQTSGYNVAYRVVVSAPLSI